MNSFILLKSIFSLTVYLDLTSASATGPLVGYYNEGLMRVMEYSLNKEPHVLTQLLKPAKIITDRMDKNGTLGFLGNVATTRFLTFFKKLDNNNYNETIRHMKDLKVAMENRRELCSAELNIIIDVSNAIVNKSDGENLNALIDEYKQFPNVNKTGEQLCQKLIEAFVKPLLKKKGKSIMQYLVDCINGLGEGAQCATSFDITATVKNYIPTERQREEIEENTTEPISGGQTWNEGDIIKAYLMFLEAILRKKDKGTRRVFRLTLQVYWKKYHEGDFDWMLSLKDFVPQRIALYFQRTKLSVMREHIKKRFYNIMKNRTTILHEDLNQVIDNANRYITAEQSEELFEIIEDFSRFPDSNKSARNICEDLMDGFCNPFKENRKELPLEKLISDVKTWLLHFYPEKVYGPIFTAHKFKPEDIYVDSREPHFPSRPPPAM